jgi:hypothetical protein
MSSSLKISRNPATLNAYRTVLRLIHSLGGREGTRLPTQSELTAKLQICSLTMDAAMKWLAEDGVVRRKQRSGTFVLRPYPLNPKRTIWHAGLVMQPITRSYFGAIITHYLHKHIHAYGISDRVYMLSPSAEHPSEVLQRSAADFTGLDDDINEGMLDIIATSTRLVTKKIPICGVVAWERVEFGVNIGLAGFVHDSVNALMHKGCKNILYVLPFDPEEFYFPSLRAALVVVDEQLRNQGVKFHSTVCTQSQDGSFVLERRFAENLLKLPEADRPDGLVVQDDITAQALASMLAITDYRPVLAAQTNLQMPLSFALPTLPFAIDLEKIAQSAAELMVQKLLLPSANPGRLSVDAVPMKEVCSSLSGWRQDGRPMALV